MGRQTSEGGRKRYHHGDLRRALVTAALELINDGGTATLTLRAVARRAGVTHAAPYRHFDDRAALLAVVAEEGFASLQAAVADAIAGAGLDSVEQLMSAGVAYVRFAVAHPAHYRVMFGAELADRSAYPALESAAEGTFVLLKAGVCAGQASGQVVTGDPKELALAAWALLHGFASLVIAGQLATRVTDAEIDGLVLRLEGILGAGIRAPEAAR